MTTLTAVSKRYGRASPVLSDVDFAVGAGEVAAITGGNGSGKSTLLRLLVGLCRPSSGSITGRPDVIGYVPDRFPPDERLSGMAYLTHMGRIRGLTGRAASARAAELLNRLGLVGGVHTPLRELSKGNAQKVALGQALLLPPRLFVLDEPWSGLDADTHGVLAEIIGEVARSGGAVVFTDHREAVTTANATVTYAITDGRIRRQPTPPTRPVRTATVVLAPAGGRQTPQPPDCSGLPGVLGVAEHQDAVTVEVTDEWCDALLAAVLRDGWSVREVRRAAAPPVPAPDPSDPRGTR